MEDTLPSRIAALVHAHFDGLPKRSKPVVRDGTAEWIPMTGIVLVKGENKPSEDLTCVAVTTGAKCLPASQIPHCKGLVLHDCHAEILAIRAFNFWLLSECASILAQEQRAPEEASKDNADISPYIRRRRPAEDTDHKHTPSPPFEINPDVRIYMYCTCAPCGDASMELCMAAQEDPTPWVVEPPTSKTESSDTGAGPNPDALLDGRAHFSRLGIVRRKPARADAESTKSKSCSDKLALRQVSSLLNYETSLLVAPTENAYIAGLVLPEEEISRVGCARAFGGDGRMSGLKGKMWPLNTNVSATNRTEITGTSDSQDQYRYEFRPFQVLSIPTEQLKSLWPFRKPRIDDRLPEPVDGQSPAPAPAKKSKPGNISAVWVMAPTTLTTTTTKTNPTNRLYSMTDNGAKTLPTLRGSKTGLFESIINGVRQGHRASAPGVRGASALCRAKLWAHLRDVVGFSSFSEGNGACLGLAGEIGEGTSETKTETATIDHHELGVPASLIQASTYRDFKKEPVVSIESVCARRCAIQSAREVLGGWVPNTGDEDWGLEVLTDSKKRKR